MPTAPHRLYALRPTFTTFSVLAILSIRAATCTALSSGNWSTAGTWSCGHAPSPGDLLIIPAGTTVSVTSNISYAGSALRVKVYGTLAFVGGGSKLDLPCGSTVEVMTASATINGTNNGNSQTITICGDPEWSVDADNNVHGYRAYPPLATLPVELLYFRCEATGDQVECTWATASESNSDRFEVRRSRNAEAAIVVMTVPSAGWSQEPLRYGSADRPPSDGTWYYELVQYDLDGTENPLMTAVVHVDDGPALRCWPNPANDRFTVSGGGPASLVVLVDDMGRTVRSVERAGDSAAIDVDGLPAGGYTVRLMGAQATATERILVQH